MTTWSSDDEADKGKRVELMAGLEEGVLVVVVDTAELDSAEILSHILVAHEERTIISISPASLSLALFCPAVRVITPITVPFEVTPRVSELEELESITELIIDLDTANQTV